MKGFTWLSVIIFFISWTPALTPLTDLLYNLFSLFSRSMFGAVVVGIGTAGWVRIRDMLAPLPGCPAEKLTVRGFISR